MGPAAADTEIGREGLAGIAENHIQHRIEHQEVGAPGAVVLPVYRVGK